ncbi:nucleotide sugar dehydrogenase [Streptomyces sp. NPDC087903]|uniref:nucleotide sugar dehydrogenase n=1 Tax=Streptomyces sp. NPDC087903 TaxID=3365819 RepID=UPI003822FE69
MRTTLTVRGVPLCLSSSEAWGSGFGEGAVAEHREQHADAAIIAEQVRIRRDLDPLRTGGETVTGLKILTGRRMDLVADRTRTVNRLRARLSGIFPGLERELGLTNTGPLTLLTGYQTSAAIRRIGAKRLETWLPQSQGPQRAGLPELLARHTASGRLRFTTSIREAADFADLHFIVVGTPIDADGRSYDTGQVYGAIRQLAPHLTRACTIVGKSTVTVGTTAKVTALAQRLAPAGERVDVVWNPEFLREGHAVEDTLRPDRPIAGLTTAEGEEAIRAVYASILDAGVPIFVTDPQTAELAKGAANTFLGLKISYINAVADMCDAADGDIAAIVEILGIDPRIGSGGMRPGIGYGGGCLPKDVRAFTASARQLGAEKAAALLRAAEEINESRTGVALGLITRALGDRPIQGARVTVWGAAFKPLTNDVRESPV